MNFIDLGWSQYGLGPSTEKKGILPAWGQRSCCQSLNSKKLTYQTDIEPKIIVKWDNFHTYKTIGQDRLCLQSRNGILLHTLFTIFHLVQDKTGAWLLQYFEVPSVDFMIFNFHCINLFIKWQSFKALLSISVTFKCIFWFLYINW